MVLETSTRQTECRMSVMKGVCYRVVFRVDLQSLRHLLGHVPSMSRIIL